METKLKQEPVADGGGLQPLSPKADADLRMGYAGRAYGQRVQELKEALAAYASSQEALRLARDENERLDKIVTELTNGGSLWRNRAISAETSLAGMDRFESPIEEVLRERMQQAVAELEPCVSHYLNQPVRTGITKAISLLSPEGSSRPAEKKKEPNDDWNDWDNGGGFDVAGK